MNTRYEDVRGTETWSDWVTKLNEDEENEVWAFVGGIAALDAPHRSTSYLTELGQEGSCTIWMGSFAYGRIDYRIYFARALTGGPVFLCGGQITGVHQDLERVARGLARTELDC